MTNINVNFWAVLISEQVDSTDGYCSHHEWSQYS
jgi:hypothetical protein